MSVNVYVKKEVSENFAALATLNLKQEKGRWFFELKSSNSPMPESVAGLVEDISFMEWILFYGGREAGIYSYKSARADIQLEKTDDGRMKVVILSKNMRDLRKLLHLLKIGDIRPEVSYEVPQGGKSRAELEAEVKSLLNELERTKLEIAKYEGAFNRAVNELRVIQTKLATAEGKLENIQKFVAELTKGSIAFCRRSWVSRRISQITLDPDKPSEG